MSHAAASVWWARLLLLLLLLQRCCSLRAEQVHWICNNKVRASNMRGQTVKDVLAH
jgi:hypothetical protein